MTKEEFLECIDKLSFVEFENYTYYTDENLLIDNGTGFEIHFNNVDDLLNYTINGKKIIEIIGAPDYELLIPISSSGRSGSGKSAQQEYSFDSAGGGRGGGEEGKKLFPATFNVNNKVPSLNNAVNKFINKHGSSSIEYAIAVDSQGYTHKYKSGGSTSVNIMGRNNQTIIHNHPSSSSRTIAFSKQDLLSNAQVKGEKGIIAVGKNAYVSFSKTPKFKATEFVKAVNNAKPKGTSYAQATNNWLKKNQKKYGYNFEKITIK